MFRELIRKKNQLSMEECIQVLNNQTRGVLSVQGEDGYPIRYRLTSITIAKDVLPSLSLYDESGMQWPQQK